MDLISPWCGLISFKAPQPASDSSIQALQKVISGRCSCARPRAWMLSGGETWFMATRCSSSRACICAPLRSSIRMIRFITSSWAKDTTFITWEICTNRPYAPSTLLRVENPSTVQRNSSVNIPLPWRGTTRTKTWHDKALCPTSCQDSPPVEGCPHLRNLIALPVHQPSCHLFPSRGGVPAGRGGLLFCCPGMYSLLGP